MLHTEPLPSGTYYWYLYNVPPNPALGVGSDVTERVSIQVDLTPT
jgi:hypothetical protein